MNLFFLLLYKILPLYFLIFLGFVAGKFLNAKKESIAPILIYLIVPIIIFNSIIKTKIVPQLLLIPVIFFLLCCLIGISFYFIGGRFFKDSTKNILGMAAGTGNTGYFGIPVCIELLGKDYLGLMILGILGFTLFESSIGFFMTARGNHSASEAINKLIKLPTLYAFFIGLTFNYLHINPGGSFDSFANNFIGAYSVLGMMLVGMGLSDVKKIEIDFKFLSLSFIAKFIIWPLAVFIIILLDKMFLKMYFEEVYKMMILISIVPMAANLVAFSTELKTQPEKAAVAVFISTIFALFYIPLLTSIIF